MPGIQTEAEARAKIHQQLEAVHWDLTDTNQVRQERTLASGSRTDYELCDRHGRAIAVIEAKKSITNPPEAREQAHKYADELGVDLVFLANGEEVWYWRPSAEAHPHRVATFFTQADLERKAQAFRARRDPLGVPIDESIAGGGGRTYQIDCINTLCKLMQQGARKLLVEMATGTGKTRTAAALIKRLFEAQQITRVLFLCDRITLARQAQQECFAEHIPELPSYVLKHGRFKDEFLITVTTLQSMVNIYQDYSAGYFDLVITDECHRSIYGRWQRVLDHFDGIKVGLTATPCVASEVDRIEFLEDRESIRDTLLFFECQRPHFVYGIREAIKDGHLAGYDIYKAKTTITADGVKISRKDVDHPDNPRDLIDELFGEKKEVYIDPLALERKITIPERNRAICREFREVLENGFQDQRGPHQPLDGKTIVFAVTKRHAQTLAAMLDVEFAHCKPAPNVPYADYVVSGLDQAGSGESASTIIDRFKYETYPKILVSVGMLDTGFDCPEATNLVMARFTKSAILYQQMRGRGSRLCTLANGTAKERFTIFDFVGVTDYFNDDSEDPAGGVLLVRRGRETKGGYRPSRGAHRGRLGRDRSHLPRMDRSRPRRPTGRPPRLPRTRTNDHP